MQVEAGFAGATVRCAHCAHPCTVPRPRIGPGVIIGGFQIIRLLGVGGMGEVYLARQLSLDRDVALKVFPPALASDKERARRFLNEVRLLARLDHPNIVTAYEAGEDDGVLFMAMAYVKGESLDALIARQGAIPERKALYITRKVAQALAYAWNEHRLLHRDIKPANILLDAQGEPKLADLGLSRTLDKGISETTENEIAGTPNYMSPEQVEGRSEVDCRSDMYSLGATLYHTLTGQLPFQANTLAETLRKQLTEPLPDPRVYQPQISEACVHLLEYMLAKDPADRHPTWEALIDDIDRVRAGRMPTGRPMIRGSVLKRERDEHALAEARRIRIKSSDLEKVRQLPHALSRPPRSRRWNAALVGLLLGAGLAAFWIWARNRPRIPVFALGPERPAEREITLSPPEPPPPSRTPEWAEEWSTLSAEVGRSDSPPGELLKRLESFRDRVRGHAFEAEVLRVIREVRERQQRVIRETMEELQQQAEKLWSEQRFDEALALVEHYAGPWADETATVRKNYAAELRNRHAEMLAQRAARTQAELSRLADELCAAILRQDTETITRISGRSAAFDDADVRALVERLIDEALPASRLAERVLETFKADVGKTVPLALTTGTETWEIRGLQNGRVLLRRQVGSGFLERSVGYEDLALVERYRRLQGETAAQTELLRGVLAARGGREDAARRHWESANTPLSRALLVYIDRAATLRRETAARSALERVARLARVSLETLPPDEAANRIRRSAYTTAEIAAIRAALAAYRRDHADAALTRELSDLLQALENVHTMPCVVDPEVVQNAIANLKRGPPALEQVYHTVTQKPDGIELVLVGNPKLENLQALAGLPLIRLNIAGTSVRDLTPLKGMPLRSIDASGCPLESLDGLEGAPLTVANFERCPIQNLQPLQGAPLVDLNIRRTRVRSLAPLAGAPLRVLHADEAELESLEGLSGAPLQRLDAGHNPKLRSLAPLAGLPLERLNVSDAAIDDLRPLAGMPLKELDLTGCIGVRDLSPLKGLPLQSLYITGTGVSDLTPLAGMPLRRLAAARLPGLRNISPLKGMPLTHLWLNHTAVEDLSPLVGAPLVQLDLRSAPVRDLSPLAESPVEVLLLDGCPQLRGPALRPLLTMPNLSILTLPMEAGRPRFLQQHESLQEIGYDPDSLQSKENFFRARQ